MYMYKFSGKEWLFHANVMWLTYSKMQMKLFEFNHSYVYKQLYVWKYSVHSFVIKI